MKFVSSQAPRCFCSSCKKDPPKSLQERFTSCTLHSKSEEKNLQKVKDWIITLTFGCLSAVFWLLKSAKGCESFSCLCTVFWLAFGCLLALFLLSFCCLFAVFQQSFSSLLVLSQVSCSELSHSLHYSQSILHQTVGAQNTSSCSRVTPRVTTHSQTLSLISMTHMLSVWVWVKIYLQWKETRSSLWHLWQSKLLSPAPKPLVPRIP